MMGNWKKKVAYLLLALLVGRLASSTLLGYVLLWIQANTKSMELAGVFGSVGKLPAAFICLLSGVVVDRFNRRYTLLGSDLLAAAGLLVGSIFYANLEGGLVSTMVCFAVAVILAETAHTLWFASVEAGLPDNLPKDKLVTANGLLIVGQQLAFFGGLALSGFFMAALEGPLLWVVAVALLVSFFIVSASSFQSQGQPANDGPRPKRTLSYFIKGLALIKNDALLRHYTGYVVVVSTIGASLTIYLPFHVSIFLKQPSMWFGVLMCGWGIGLLMGMLGVGKLVRAFGASRRSFQALLGVCISSTGLLGIMDFWPVSVFCLVFQGASAGGIVVWLRTSLQLHVASAHRGRVMTSLDALVTLAMAMGMGLTSLTAGVLPKISYIPPVFAGLLLLYAGYTALSSTSIIKSENSL